MVSRFDKYEPRVGGFRAPLLAAITSADVGKIQAVSLNTSGQVVIGGPAETAIIGVIVAVRPMAAAEAIDVMTDGEIAEATKTGGTAWAAGDIVYAHGTAGGVGIVDAVAATGKIIGKMQSITRMIVRCPMATT
jgi:hypothetical protein